MVSLHGNGGIGSRGNTSGRDGLFTFLNPFTHCISRLFGLGLSKMTLSLDGYSRNHSARLNIRLHEATPINHHTH
jgi:hypothetical protein